MDETQHFPDKSWLNLISLQQWEMRGTMLVFYTPQLKSLGQIIYAFLSLMPPFSSHPKHSQQALNATA